MKTAPDRYDLRIRFRQGDAVDDVAVKEEQAVRIKCIDADGILNYLCQLSRGSKDGHEQEQTDQKVDQDASFDDAEQHTKDSVYRTDGVVFAKGCQQPFHKMNHEFYDEYHNKKSDDTDECVGEIVSKRAHSTFEDGIRITGNVMRHQIGDILWTSAGRSGVSHQGFKMFDHQIAETCFQFGVLRQVVSKPRWIQQRHDQWKNPAESAQEWF